MRAPAVAGQFYPGDARSVKQALKKAYLHQNGPGSEPKVNPKREGRIKGLVVPHAGYTFSAQIAAHAFKALAEDGMPESVIILGPNHSGWGSGVAMTDKDHRTPLGRMDIDTDLAKALFSGIIDNSEQAHRREHSIEVQLPFLQQLKPNLQFVPIAMMMQDPKTATLVGQQMATAIAGSGKDVVVIASNDMTHYQQDQVARTKDARAIEHIEQFDIKGLYSTVREHNITMCGIGPVAAMITACKEMGARQAKLLKYATSGDVHDMSEVVGYAAMEVF